MALLSELCVAYGHPIWGKSVQDPELRRADLERVCHQRGWQVVKTYEVEESAFGKTPRQQFQAMLDDARKGKFNVLVVWSLDRFSREGEWSVS